MGSHSFIEAKLERLRFATVNRRERRERRGRKEAFHTGALGTCHKPKVSLGVLGVLGGKSRDRAAGRLGLTLANSSTVNESRRAAMIDRRDFVRAMLSMSAAIALPLRHDVPTIRFALIERSGQSGTWGTFRDGVTLGYSEAKRAALLFPQARLELVDLFDHGVPVSVRGIPELLAKRGARVILAALGDDDARSVAMDCDRLKIIFMNCGARGDALRRDVCSPYVFHVQASDAMYAAAAKIAGHESNVVLWDSSLEKYGAAQLNDRYRAGSGTGMDAAGWAGWFAIKVIWESLLHAKSEESAALAYYMSSDSAQYDGHKGAPLSFRAWDRQLRQPLFSIAKARKAGQPPVREIPDVGRSSGPVRELLDTIGDGPTASMCKAQ